MKGIDADKLLKDLDAKGVAYVLGPTMMPDLSIGVAESRPPMPRKRGKKESALLPYCVVDSGDVLRITIPVVTKNLVNMRAWQAKSNVTRICRAEVCKCLGKNLRRLADFAEHYHAGNPIFLTFTRVGGRKVDNMAGLGPTLKPIEDAVALVLGADDGDPRWRATAGQMPGVAVGVIVSFSKSP